MFPATHTHTILDRAPRVKNLSLRCGTYSCRVPKAPFFTQAGPPWFNSLFVAKRRTAGAGARCEKETIVELAEPEAILFDMGGVLLESVDMWDEAGFHKSFPSGLPEPVSTEWFIALSRDLIRVYEAQPLPRSAMDPRPLIASWLHKIAIDPTPETVERWYDILAQWEVRPLYPFVRPTLEALRAMGLRLGLISNTLMVSDGHRRLFRAGGILEYFEFLVFSAEFGMNKPDPSIFRYALSAMALNPADAWYVGDKPHRDVCGAHSVGMKAVLVDSIYVDRIHDGDAFVPDLRIRDIAALPSVLREMREPAI